MASKIKIGINGFGRIGRVVTRLALQREDIEIVGINDLCRPEQLVHLLKYDSVHGGLKADVRLEGDTMVLNDQRIRLTAQSDPSQLAWSSLGVACVHECTGVFTEREQAAQHLRAGAKRVIVSAPSKDADVTLVLGVNDSLYDPSRHVVVSNASCTTNGLAPLCKVLDENFGIVRGTMMTVHSYTNDQNVLDLPHRDPRRARAGALSMIPTTTGATKALGVVMPHLKGRIDGMAVRVPTPNVSLIDFTAELKAATTRDGVNAAFKAAAGGALKGILEFTLEPKVSIDYNGNEASATIDGELTSVIGGNFVKVIAWYDNETGFSARMLDLTAFMARKGM